MKKFLKLLQTKNKLFEDFSAEEILNMLNCLSARKASYQKEECIILQDSPLFEVGIIVSGQARLEREDLNGNVIILSKLSEGDLFGEAFVCAGIAQIPISVWANTNTEVVFVNYQKIIKTCSSACSFHTKLIRNILQLMAGRLIMLQEKMGIIQKSSIRDKLMALFESHMMKTGSKRFTIAYNRGELAKYIGINRSALSRELGKMRDEGLIEFSGNKFHII